MTTRRAFKFKALIFQSILPTSRSFSLLSTTSSSPDFSSSFQNFHPILRIHCHSLFSFIPRFISTTSFSDNLEGLVDPVGLSLSEASRVESFSAEEFSLLRDSLLDSNAESGSSSVNKFESGKFSSEAVSILNSIKNNGDGFGDQTQKCLRQFREKLNESLVIEVLKLLQNPELGVKFFLWAGRQIGYCHTAAVYNALLDIVCSDGNHRVPESYLREIKGDDTLVLGKLLNVLIRKCCRNGLWNVALEELGRLKDFGYKPTRGTYNALVQVFVIANRLDSAHLIHREMREAGFWMDEFTLGCYAHVLCKAGKWREALDLIENEEFVPNVILYTKMISGLCEASLFDVAMEYLERMRASSCIPNVVTFRVLLCGCLSKRKLGMCKRILGMMIAEGCYPSPSIFNSLVQAYCKSGDISYAYKLLKKMTKCGYQPGYVVYNILIGAICCKEELPSPELLDLAENVYAEMFNLGVVLNKVNISNFAKCLCAAGKFEKAYNVISEMMSKGFVPNTSTYSKVITFLCNYTKVDKAFLLFEQMKRNGVVPDVYVYTILIDSFCKAGLIQQACNWFNEMVQNGCFPNVVTYTALIHAHLKAKKVSDADKLFEKMLNEGCIPNIVTYTALIDGLCKAGNVEKACLVYARMKENLDIPDVDVYFRIGACNVYEPDAFTYGALIDGLCKVNKVKEARDLLDAMSMGGCEPNHIVYDALIDGFSKAGKLDDAQDVFAKMLARGYSPSVYTYSSLIGMLFKDKRLDHVMKILSEMLENSCQPNVVIYSEMIDGLCKVGKTDEAYKLMLMMEEKGCYPNVVTYTAMIDGYGKAGKIEKCLELFQKMCSKSCAPNFITYRVMIKHCCAAGLLDEAHNLLVEMKQTYWPKHMASYHKVIQGYNRKFLESLGLLNEISENESVPIFPMYSLLIDNFIKAGKLDIALELHEEIASSSPLTYANKNIYNSFIESFSHANKVGKAFELYADMIRQGCIPEISTFVHLIKGLIKINKWEEALELSDSLCKMDIHWIQQEQKSE